MTTWLDEASRHLGESANGSPDAILAMWREVGFEAYDGTATPYCDTFVHLCLGRSGYAGTARLKPAFPRSLRATQCRRSKLHVRPGRKLPG